MHLEQSDLSARRDVDEALDDHFGDDGNARTRHDDADEGFEKKRSKKAEQEELFGEDDALKKLGDMLLGLERQKSYEIKLAIAIKGTKNNSQAQVIPICKGSVRAEWIEEVVMIAINSKFFLEQLRAAVGAPSGQLADKLDAHKARVALEAEQKKKDREEREQKKSRRRGNGEDQ